MRGRKRPRSEETEEDEKSEGTVELCARNHVVFYAPVTPKTLAKLRMILLECEHRQRSDEYFLHIQSDGGCAYSGLNGYDIVSTSPLEIHTVVEGSCCSAATLLSLAGRKRYMLPHASYMIHQVSTTVEGTFDELAVDLQNSTTLMQQYVDLYVRRTGLTKARVAKNMKNDLAMTMKQALADGFIDAAWP
jgi:ATP-dependent Clp protease protease subunit